MDKNSKAMLFLGGMITGAYLAYNHLYKRIAKAVIKNYEDKLNTQEDRDEAEE